MNVFSAILSILWFFLPAYCANTSPIFAKHFNWLEFLNKPVDAGKKWRGQRLFGSHKTIRGFVMGILWATFAIVFQYLIYEQHGYFHRISLIQYDQHSLLLLGFLFGFGALFGDLMKSFIKRRVGIGSGEKFIPWDEFDYTLGTFLFLSPIIFPGWLFVLAALVLNFSLHFAANGIGYLLGMKEVWW